MSALVDLGTPEFRETTQSSGRKSYNRVRTEARDGKIVKVKFCPACDTDRVWSREEDSEFRTLMRKGRPRVAYLCKVCERNRRRELYAERIATDPEYRERKRSQSRAGHEKWIQKPGSIEVRRAAGDRWKAQKRKEDPDYFREYQRMAYALRRERAGYEVKPRAVPRESQPRFPAELFRRWLIEYACVARLVTQTNGEVSVNEQELAFDLGLVPRRVRSVIGREQQNVSLGVVDTALTNARFLVEVDGRVIATLDDLYGEA